MPDENGTENVRPDAVDADDSPFWDAPDATVVDEGDSDGETGQGPQGSDDSGDGVAQDSQESAGTGDKATPSEDLKVVVSIRGGRAVIGVQQPSSDPYIETFEDTDLPALAQEVPAVTERARARWEESPKHPAYERPAPPARPQRNRRQQGAAQDTTAETQEAKTQQQTLRLF